MVPPLPSRSPVAVPVAPGVAEPVGLEVVPSGPGRLVQVADSVLGICLPASTVLTTVAVIVRVSLSPGAMVPKTKSTAPVL